MPPQTQAVIDVVERLDALESLADTWPSPSEEGGSPMLSFTWVRASAETFAEPERLRVVTVTTNGRLDAVAPLHAPPGSRRIEVLGGQEIREPYDFVYRDEAALETLARAVADLGEPLVIPRMASASPTVEALRRAYGRRALVVAREAGATPIVHLAHGPPELEQLLSPRRQCDLRRARRRAEALGSLRFEVVAPGPSELEHRLEEFLRVEAASWKGRTGTALAYDPVRGPFYRRYAAAAAADGTLRLAFMRLDDRPIAAQLAVEYGRRLWLLKIGYDEDFARCSPGQLLMLEAIREAASRDLDAVEFLGHADDWTRVWTAEERPCVSLRVYPLAARGVRVLAEDAAELGRRRVVRPLAKRAGGHYVAGAEVEDAVSVARRLAEGGRHCTIAYWDAAEEGPRVATNAALATVDALTGDDLDGYVSVKATALGFAGDLAREIAHAASTASVSLHFDSMGPEAADATFELIASLQGSVDLGCTLPGRWQRSLADADSAVEQGLRVRVVKGEWVDPAAPRRDPRAGFLEIVDRLAGRAAHVAVATHDRRLAEDALSRLGAAGTPCELELLYRRREIAVAGVGTRVYIPFGYPWVPYPIAEAPWKPKIAWQFARDLVTAGRARARARDGTVH